MTNKYMYFVANWKMYGSLSSLNSLNKVIKFSKSKDIKKGRLIYCPPFTLIDAFSKKFKNCQIGIGGQNCPIGSGVIPTHKDLFETIKFIKNKFRDKPQRVLYGGSVNPKNIINLKKVNNLDGFLVGGASQSAKKFIDIVKKTYS